MSRLDLCFNYPSVIHQARKELLERTFRKFWKWVENEDFLLKVTYVAAILVPPSLLCACILFAQRILPFSLPSYLLEGIQLRERWWEKNGVRAFCHVFFALRPNQLKAWKRLTFIQLHSSSHTFYMLAKVHHPLLFSPIFDLSRDLVTGYQPKQRQR